MNFFYPTVCFRSPMSGNGRRNFIQYVARAKKDGVAPEIFYTNGSYEYWGRNGD